MPPGVINVVPQDHSDEMLCPVVHDNRVRKTAVVGSPSLGRSILYNSPDLQQNHIMCKQTLTQNSSPNSIFIIKLNVTVSCSSAQWLCPNDSA